MYPQWDSAPSRRSSTAAVLMSLRVLMTVTGMPWIVRLDVSHVPMLPASCERH
jgi:hypothetical protein